MIPIEFPQHNVKLAEDQEEYLMLPAYQDQIETISCWRLTDEDIELLKTNRVIWLRQMNFGKPLQPQLPTLKDPFDD